MTGAVACVLADRYRLSSRIAAGGMGEVWRAEDLLLDRDVAVKLLRRDLVADEASRVRFRAEARAAARLVHPGIASVYDFGESADHAWLVLELVVGEPLSALLRRRGRLTSGRTLDLVAQTATALQAAHEAGVVHRDVKPGNLLVGEDGVVKVTDFGIASSTGRPAPTPAENIVGTAGYLSPEQVDGRGATAASDLYALGVVAYECLSGTRPFVADTPVAVLFAHLHAPPPELPPAVPPAVGALVLGLLAKDPAQRPGPAAAVAARATALRRQITAPVAGGPAAVRVRPPPLGRPPTTARRHAASRTVTSLRTQRRAVRATAVVLALLAVVLGGDSLWGGPVQVPDIAAGTPVAEAAAAVDEAGLDPLQRTGSSDDIAVGHVLAQRPEAGTEVEPGSQVVLVVSSGPDPAAATASSARGTSTDASGDRRSAGERAEGRDAGQGRDEGHDARRGDEGASRDGQ